MNGYRWISGFHDYQRVCKNMQMRDVDTIEAFPFQVLELLSLSLVSTEIGAECLGTWVDRESHVYAHCCWLNSCSIAILVNSVCWTILGLLPCVCAALPCMTIQNRNSQPLFVTDLSPTWRQNWGPKQWRRNLMNAYLNTQVSQLWL